MSEYWTVAQIADHFGISEKRAANLASEHKIPHVRVYPADQIKKIPRLGQGARTDLKGQK